MGGCRSAENSVMYITEFSALRHPKTQSSEASGQGYHHFPITSTHHNKGRGYGGGNPPMASVEGLTRSPPWDSYARRQRAQGPLAQVWWRFINRHPERARHSLHPKRDHPRSSKRQGSNSIAGENVVSKIQLIPIYGIS